MNMEPHILSRDELIKMVSEWIEMDTEINKLNKSMTNIKKELQNINKNKKKITDQLLEVIKRNETDIVLGKNTLVHKVSKKKKPITKKYLLEQLNSYYKNQPEIAKDVSIQILNNREVVVSEDIVLKINS